MMQFYSRREYLINAIAFSPNGRFLAFSGVFNQTINVINILSGNLVQTFDSHSFYIGSVAFSSNGTILKAAEIESLKEGSIKIWENRVEIS